MPHLARLRIWMIAAALLVFSTAVLRAAPGQESDLAVVGIVAPRAVPLTPARPEISKPITVIVENRGAQTKTIPDATTLERLVGLEVAPLGNGATAQSVLVPPRSFPLTFQPGQKRSIVFRVTFELGDAPAELAGFRYAALIEGARQAPASAAESGTGTVATASPWGVVSVKAAEPSSPERSARVSSAGPRGPDNGATVTPSTERVAVKAGGVSDFISFSAKWPGVSYSVSGWSSTPADPAADPIFDAVRGSTVKAQWQNPGDYSVKVYLFRNGTFQFVSPSVDIHVIKMEFKDENDGTPPEPVRVGITTHGGIFEKDRSQTLKVKVTPASQVNEVEVKAAGGSESRLRVFGQQVSGDTITFKIEGVGMEGSKTPGDAKIEAKVKGSSSSVKVEQAVSVVRPSKILAQITGPQRQENIQLNTLTTPSDPRIPANLVVLATFYGWFITVPVRDQFGDTIGESKLYLDAPIYENFLVGGELQPLKRTNMKVSANSSYLDPVGVPIGRGYPSTYPSLMNLPPYNSLASSKASPLPVRCC